MGGGAANLFVRTNEILRSSGHSVIEFTFQDLRWDKAVPSGQPIVQRKLPDFLKRNFLGNILRTWNSPNPQFSAGMICYVPNGNLWIKPNGDTRAYLYDLNSNMGFLREINTSIRGEGIAYDHAGNIWVHGDCIIKKINLETLVSATYDSPNYTCGSEGLAFDYQNNLWLSSDEGYHGGMPGGNQVWKMTPGYFE